MTRFVEKYRNLLNIYWFIANFLGWFLILGGIIWCFLIIRAYEASPPQNDELQIELLLYTSYSFVYDFIIPGLLAFSIGGLLDYLLRPEAKPRLILRMTDKLCYLYAFFLIMKFYGAIKSFGSSPWFVNFKLFTVQEMTESVRILLVQPKLGPTLAKVLLLVGIGIILHRLLPVIEESKTLV